MPKWRNSRLLRYSFSACRCKGNIEPAPVEVLWRFLTLGT